MDKFRKVLDLIDNPGEYSPEEIDAILSDHEMRGIYETLSATSAAFHAEAVDADADQAWRRFSGGHRRRTWRVLWRQRRAAIVASVVATSLIAVGMGIGLSVRHRQSLRTADSRQEVAAAYTPAANTGADSLTTAGTTIAEQLPATVEFEDETLETIMERIAAHYGLQVRYESAAPRSLRLYYVWDTTLPAQETVASLDNFERFSVSLQGAIIVIK